MSFAQFGQCGVSREDGQQHCPNPGTVGTCQTQGQCRGSTFIRGTSLKRTLTEPLHPSELFHEKASISQVASIIMLSAPPFEQLFLREAVLHLNNQEHGYLCFSWLCLIEGACVLGLAGCLRHL